MLSLYPPVLVLTDIAAFTVWADPVSIAVPPSTYDVHLRAKNNTTTSHGHVTSRETPILPENATDSTSGRSQSSAQPTQPGIRKPLVVVTLVIAACVLLAMWYFVIRNIWRSCLKKKEVGREENM